MASPARLDPVALQAVEPDRPRLAFVLEQTLGHVAHGRNVARAIERDPTVDAVVIPVGYSDPTGWHRLPGLKTWSWRASEIARDALRARLANGPLDAIFIHTQVVSLLATEIMRSVPTVVSLDATPVVFDREGPAYGHRRGPEVVESIKRRINARTFGLAARLVTWSRSAAYSLISDYAVPADKIDVIPPGVDLTMFRPLLVARRTDRIRVLFVGGDFERKGGPDLIEAAHALPDHVDVDIVTNQANVVVPPGVRVRVHTGLKAHSEKLVQLYRNADIFALPSRGDCMPQAVAEALACGLPVVATAVGAIPEMVADKVNGYLVRPGNPRAIAAAISALANSRRMRFDMGRRSLKLAQLEHDAAANNTRIISILKTLARARRSVNAAMAT
jgi:glycosyltransferase involved in cell wall biosynthesis